MSVTRKNLSVVVGTYQKDGQDKNRYMNVGTLIETEKSTFIELNPFVDFTALPRKDGRLLINIFDEEKQKSDAPKPKSSGIDDEIPF